jgi:hypothetical protein
MSADDVAAVLDHAVRGVDDPMRRCEIRLTVLAVLVAPEGDG